MLSAFSEDSFYLMKKVVTCFSALQTGLQGNEHSCSEFSWQYSELWGLYVILRFSALKLTSVFNKVCIMPLDSAQPNKSDYILDVCVRFIFFYFFLHLIVNLVCHLCFVLTCVLLFAWSTCTFKYAHFKWAKCASLIFFLQQKPNFFHVVIPIQFSRGSWLRSYATQHIDIYFWQKTPCTCVQLF